MSLAEKVWCKVTQTETGCWEWQGAKNALGYGVIKDHGKFQQAHRVAWSLHHQEEIPPGLVVMHSCDNPPCINPAHLRVGTVAENNQDRHAKGRTVLPYKLTPAQVEEIRARFVRHSKPKSGRGTSSSELAREYGVHPLTIWRVTR